MLEMEDLAEDLKHSADTTRQETLVGSWQCLLGWIMRRCADQQQQSFTAFAQWRYGSRKCYHFHNLREIIYI